MEKHFRYTIKIKNTRKVTCRLYKTRKPFSVSEILLLKSSTQKDYFLNIRTLICFTKVRNRGKFINYK